MGSRQFSPSGPGKVLVAVATAVLVTGAPAAPALADPSEPGPATVAGLATEPAPEWGGATGDEGEAELGWQPTFSGPGLDGSIGAMTIWDDGTGPALYAGGQFVTAGGHEVDRVARWDGESWSPLAGPDGVGVTHDSRTPSVQALTVYEGELVVGGTFTEAGGVPAHNLARWDGQRWAAFDGPVEPGVNDTVQALTVYDGDLVVGGLFTQAGGDGPCRSTDPYSCANWVAGWDGEGWYALSRDGEIGISGTVRALREFRGELVVAGGFLEVNHQFAGGIAAWDGEGWSLLAGPAAPGTDHFINALTVHDGELVAGGTFQEAGGVAVERIATWDGQAWSPLAGPGGGGLNQSVDALLTLDGDLFVGGSFTEADGAEVHHVARWDGVEFSPLAGDDEVGVDGRVWSLASMDGDLLVGGAYATAGGAVVNNLARWNGGWSPVASLSSGIAGGGVRALAEYGGELIAAGTFDRAGEVAVDHIARWDGQRWAPLAGPDGAGLHGIVADLTVYDGALYAAGIFTEAGGVPASRVARWDGEEWSALSTAEGEGLDGAANALTVYDGELVIGGDFDSAGGVPASNIARWDGERFAEVGGGTARREVMALAVFDGDLYAGGRFREIGGVPVGRIARWDGSGWSPLAGSQGEGVSLFADVLVEYDGALIVGGSFNDAGGLDAPNIARWDGQDWSTLGPGVDHFGPDALAVHEGALIAGGHFQRIGEEPIERIARWDGEQWSALPSPGGARVSGPASGATVSALASLESGPAAGSLVAGGTFLQTGGVASWRLARYGLPAEEPEPPAEPVCTETVTGLHSSALTVSEGVTCLAAGAQVLGEVNVAGGAGLVASAAVVQGPVSAVGASVVDLAFTQVTGPVLVSGGSGRVSLFAGQVTGSVSIVGNSLDAAPVVAGNTVVGSLSCFGNEPPPTDQGLPNTATAGALGQCADAPASVEITTDGLPTLHVLEPYHAALEAEHGSPPYHWEAAGLPDGLTLDAELGVIENDPEAPAVTTLPDGPVTVTVTDGRGDTDQVELPLDVVAVERMAVGHAHACAVTTATTVHCWGDNGAGQLGDGGTESRGLPAPVRDPDDPDEVFTGAVDISARESHTCVTTVDGEAYCWGFNGAGRLGRGHETPEVFPLPGPVVGPDGGGDHLTGVVSVSAGGLHTCALTDAGESYCWGDNFRGQLGYAGQGGGVPDLVRDPAGGQPLSGLTAIGTGGFHSCAVTAETTAFCWGWNHVGQLGTGSTVPAQSSAPLAVTDPAAPGEPLAGLERLSGGAVHSCAGTTEGTGYCWGQNAAGQLGDGEAPANRDTPTVVVDPDDPDRPLTGLAAVGTGMMHSCAVTTVGGAYCWGSNSGGQLGDGGTADADLPVAVADPATPAEPFGEVASLAYHGWLTCAVTTAGLPYCWGSNADGQIGDGTTEDRHLPTPVHPGRP